MVVPHYAYLKMKMSGPKGIITISGDLQNAYQCNLLAIENAVQNLDPAQCEFDYVHMQGQGSGLRRQLHRVLISSLNILKKGGCH